MDVFSIEQGIRLGFVKTSEFRKGGGVLTQPTLRDATAYTVNVLSESYITANFVFRCSFGYPVRFIREVNVRREI
jgi:hypothetical protein